MSNLSSPKFVFSSVVYIVVAKKTLFSLRSSQRHQQCYCTLFTSNLSSPFNCQRHHFVFEGASLLRVYILPFASSSLEGDPFFPSIESRISIMIFSKLLLFLLFTALIAICFADEQDTGETGVGDATTGNDNANETTAGYNAGDADDAGNTTATNTTVPASQSPAANSTQGTSNETTSESDSHLSSLYINTVKPGRGSPIITPVFKENSLVSSFNSCRLADDDSFRLDGSADCFEDDAFNDRLAFQITYHISGSVVQKAFEDHRPNLSLLGDSRNVAESTISGYSVDIPNSNAKVSISYGCKQDSDAEISLRLRLQFGDDDDSIIDIFWKKMCKSGLNDEIEFGYVVQDKDSGEEEHHEFGTDSDAPYIVSPGDVSTEIYLKVNTPGAQQEFLSPSVRAKNPQVVTVSVRGNHPKGGTLQGLLSTSFQVSYECLTKGSSDILVDVAIPPFQNLSTTYRKGMCFFNIFVLHMHHMLVQSELFHPMLSN